MKAVASAIGLAVLTIGIIVGIMMGGNALSLWSFSVFSPKVTAVQNQVFHESQQYNDGMLANLADFKLDYARAKTQGEKDAIAAAVHQQYGRYPKDKMPTDLREFYDSLP